MKSSIRQEPDAFRSAAEGIVAALAAAGDTLELDNTFVGRIERLGYRNAGYIHVFSEGRFHRAEFLFGRTEPGWAERYQKRQYSADDPVVMAACRMTGGFTLNEVAAPSPVGAAILKDSRTHGLFDGFVAPIRAGYDEVGLVLLGADHLLELADYERFLLRGICEGRAGAASRTRSSTGIDPARDRMPQMGRGRTQRSADRYGPGAVAQYCPCPCRGSKDEARRQFAGAARSTGRDGGHPEVRPLRIAHYARASISASPPPVAHRR